MPQIQGEIMLYTESPNIVEISLSDKSGVVDRFIRGLSLDEVLEVIISALSQLSRGGDDSATKPKMRHKRRTKAEMETQATPTKPPEIIPETLGSPAPRQRKGHRAKSLWPENEKEPVIAA